MNIFIPQSIQTQIELEEIADVKRQVITPATSRTIIGIVQDSLIGAYNLTQPSMRVDWKNAMNIISYTSIDDFKFFKKDKQYTGHELFSLIIPPKINVNKSIVVNNGVLKEGKLTKDFLGAKKQGALHQLIWDEHGVDETMKFMDNTNRLINNFNLFNGFTVGIGDLELPSDVREQLNTLFQTKELKVSHLITEVENNPDLMTNELYERAIFMDLNTVLEDASSLIAKNIKSTNNFGIQVFSGAKGEARNIGQMAGCVGMQAFEGALIPKKINSRTLPYFFQNDDRSASRGLITRAYVTGMTYPEFVYHNMTGRVGLIDGAVKTSESGYIQRKLVKSQEDIIVKYDRTVRGANEGIIQFVYGDTGADTTKQYDYNVNFVKMGNKELAEKYTVKESDFAKFGVSKEKNNGYYNLIADMRDIMRDSQFKSKMEYKILPTSYMIPVNFQSIIDGVKNDEVLKQSKEKLTFDHVVTQLDKIIKNDMTRLVCMPQKNVNNEKSLKFQDEQIAKTSFKMALHDSFAPSKCFYDHDFNKSQFDAVINKIITSYNKNIVEAGEMVGIIAAQSIGEPTTQLSVDGNTSVLVKYDNKCHNVLIKDFVDYLLGTNKEKVKKVPDHLNSVVLDLEKDYQVVGVLDNEKLNWKKISQVSKHPANGKLIKIKLQSGKSVVTTLSHSHLRRTSDSIAQVKGSDLQIGDKIPVAKNIPFGDSVFKLSVGDTNWNLDEHFGKITADYLCGKKVNATNKVLWFLEDNFGADCKHVPGFVFNSNYNCVKGFIANCFGDNISVKMKSKKIINDISLLLCFVGINSVVYKDKMDYACKIHPDYVSKFERVTGKNYSHYMFSDTETIPELGNVVTECAKLLNIVDAEFNKLMFTKNEIENIIKQFEFAVKQNNINDDNVAKYILTLKQARDSDVMWDDIVKIKILDDPNEYVYDFTVPGNDSFMVNSGIIVHNTLNSFHASGIAAISSVTQGVPRLKELLSLAKKIKTPQMVLYLNKEFMASKEMANKIASYIKYTTLGHLRDKITVFFDNDPHAKDGFMEKDNCKNIYKVNSPGKMSCQADHNGLPWLMRIELNREKMLEKQVTMLDIKSKFCSMWEKRIVELKNMKKEERSVIEKITALSISSNTDNDQNPIVHIRFEMEDYDIYTINDFIDNVVDKFKLKGIGSIDDITLIDDQKIVSFDNIDNSPEQVTQFAIYTAGVNLKDIRTINGIDVYRSTCNDVTAVYESFGIEAARAVLAREIHFAYSRASSAVNYHHISVLVDMMTFGGNLISVDRHGMNKSDIDPLSRASFEKTVDQLLTAAVYGEVDHMKGVSSRIIVGAVVKGGTGMCDLVLDTDMLQNSEYLGDSSQKYGRTYIPLIKNNINEHFVQESTEEIFIPV